ncbi:hypothetical protein SDC9_187006 [bioreactor metagenome]|uniref:Uncharacterized protein n=1 Tax=bioreactor metagenome TaxID=1076179 RepID=A0A645HKD3_9ZZZZ
MVRRGSDHAVLVGRIGAPHLVGRVAVHGDAEELRPDVHVHSAAGFPRGVSRDRRGVHVHRSAVLDAAAVVGGVPRYRAVLDGRRPPRGDPAAVMGHEF